MKKTSAQLKGKRPRCLSRDGEGEGSLDSRFNKGSIPFAFALWPHGKSSTKQVGLLQRPVVPDNLIADRCREPADSVGKDVVFTGEGRSGQGVALGRPMLNVGVVGCGTVARVVHIPVLPSGLHAEAAAAALNAGKSVYLEKLIAVSLDEARRVLEARRRAGVAGMMGFKSRFNPLCLAARASEWSSLRRLLFTCGSPLIPFVRVPPNPHVTETDRRRTADP